MTRLFQSCFLLFLLTIACTLSDKKQSVDSLDIYFDLDRSIPGNDYSSTIRGFLSRKAADSLLIIGYADTAGTKEYNFKLSQRRADWTRHVVIETLKENKKIRLIAGGETDQSPIAEKNRRATIFVYYQNRRTEIPVSFSKLDTAFTLDHIYFQPDKAYLTPESEQMMPILLKRLERFRSDSIEIRGHVNQAGAELSRTDPLFKLSEQRARIIYQYFVDYGYDPARLSYRGMGNSQTKSTERLSEEEQRRNMRVELVIYKRTEE